ncbi:MAG: beta-propeller fold lactonase family protein [Candidatus Aegiribacteria sp.]|nr:beta-propeller fold lactonase family protein [Candidatus Aegiribacteria sp.]
MISFVAVIFCFLLLCGSSEYGVPADELVQLDVHSGITADQIIPVPGACFAETVTNLDPGVVPEGDYLMDITFSNDGQKILICNYMTENITVIDCSSMSVDTTFSVNGNPGAIACSDDYAVVAFPFSDRIDILSLADWSVAGSFSTGVQPWVIRISEDGGHAFVACDVDNVCEVIDLTGMTHELTISDFPIWLCSYGFGSESNRFSVKYSGFEPVSGGTHLTVGDGVNTLYFFNTSTGNADHTVVIPEIDNVALSGDGSYITALSTMNPVTLYKIDIASHTIEASVAVTGHTSGMTKQIAVNQDGSKAYISTSGNTSTLVRFSTGDFKTFSSTYSAFWIGVSNDHTLAVSGQYRYSIIDFATETMVAQSQGNSQYFGCVSPVANETASYNPYGYEGAYLYSFNGSSITYRGGVQSGSEIEGDGTRRAAIAPDGSVAVLSNTMSDNVSIVDLSSLEVIAVLEIGDRVQDAAITPDSKWAVICGFNSNSVKIVDLETNTIVADVPTGTRASVVSLTPDGNYAYVGNISSNTVSVVELDGASSQEIAEIPCGIIGVVYAACGVSSDVKVSPDGAYCLVAASFDDRVKVIDTASNTVVADLVVGDFPIQIAFNADGSRAVVSNYFHNSISIIDVDGTSSYVVGTWYTGDGPLRVAYDIVTDRFAIGLYIDKVVQTFDPETGQIIATYSYTSSGSVLDLDYTDDGSRLVLTAAGSGTPCRLHRDSEQIDLAGGAVYFDYCNAADVAIAVVPGPDYGIIVNWSPQGVSENEFGVEDLPGLAVSPNPGVGCFAFRVVLPSASSVNIGVYDLCGRLVSGVAESSFASGITSVEWDAVNENGAALPPGVYAVRLDACGKTVSRLMTVCE